MQETEIQATITRALMGTLTEDAWAAADPYMLRHLAAHAAAGGRLGELTGDAGFMVNAEPGRLLDVLGVVGVGAYPLARTYWRAANHLRDAEAAERADILRTIAVQDEPEAARMLPAAEARPLGVRWAKVAGSDFHRTLTGHRGPVNALVFTALRDGTPLLASGGDDHVVRLWDPVSGAPHTTLTGHTGAVEALAALTLGDGTRLLAGGGADRVIHLWDPETATHHSLLEGHTGAVKALAAVPLPGGDVLLAAGDDDGVVRLWEPGTGRRRATLTGHVGPVGALAFAVLPDGRPVLASAGNTVFLWDLESRSGTVLGGHRRTVNAVAFVSLTDGSTRLVSADTEGVVLWDPVAAKWAGDLPRENTWVFALAFTSLSDGTPMMAGVVSGNRVRVWGPEFKAVRATLRGHTAGARALAFGRLPDGATVLASAGKDHIVRLWDPAGPRHRSADQGPATGVSAVASATLPGDTLVVAGAGNDGTIRLWDASTGKPLIIVNSHSGSVKAVAFITQPDGDTLLAGACYDEILRIWDPESGEITASLPRRSTQALAMTTLPDGTVVAASGGYSRKGPALTSEEHGDMDSGVDAVTLLPSSGNVLVLAGAGFDRALELWDPITAELRTRLVGDSVRALIFVTGLDLLVGAGDDPAVQLWDPVHPERHAVLTGHTGWVGALACATLPSGRTVLASGGYDGTVRLWDPVTRQALHTMPVGATVHALTFAGAMLVAGTARGVVVFDVGRV